MRLFAALYIILSCSLLSAQSLELTYEQRVFDSDTCCWRKFSAEGNHNEAAQLIVEFLRNNSNTVNKHSLKWHAGQEFAAAGNNRQAVKYYKKTYNIFYKWFGEEAWYYYARGNVAYVKKDKTLLKKTIAKWDKKKLEKDINYKELIRLQRDLENQKQSK